MNARLSTWMGITAQRLNSSPALSDSPDTAPPESSVQLPHGTRDSAFYIAMPEHHGQPSTNRTHRSKSNNWPRDALSSAPHSTCVLWPHRTRMNNADTAKYPLLEAVLAIQNLPLQPMYTNRDVALMFRVCTRAIQSWISAQRLTPRSLPGRWKYFPQDIEDFLRNSRKGDQ